jgi:hypothetical protein
MDFCPRELLLPRPWKRPGRFPDHHPRQTGTWRATAHGN